MKPSSKNHALAGFLLRFALLAAVAWYGWRHTLRMEETAALVNHTTTVRHGLDRLLSGLQYVEAEERGFAGTAGPGFSEPFGKGVMAVADQLRSLELEIRDGEQMAALAALKPLIAEWVEAARSKMELGQDSSAETGAACRIAMEKIRTRLSQMDAREHALLDQHSADARMEANSSTLFILIGTGLGFVLLITAFMLVARENRLRRLAEKEIVRLNADLHRRATQLEEANRELESFSFSVSHDLRAPLRHVQGYVQMLMAEAGGTLSEKGRRFLNTINDASVEMGQLIHNLLHFSRMGRVEMSEGCVPLDLLMQETLRGLEMALRGRNIEWKIAPLPRVTGDAAMLRQVLANLVGNAVKYTRKRDRALIEIGCAGEEDGRLIFSVRDNGAGFDMQHAHKLFGVFQRLHRAEEFEGTGIGLANVRRIIGRHGGRVWAEGRPDAGAVFFFTLKPAPSARSEEGSPAPVLPHTPPANDHPRDWETVRAATGPCQPANETAASREDRAEREHAHV